MTPADVERIGQAFRVVGANIEQDGQRGGGMEPTAACVERQFADRDAHPAGTLVTETENALAVGHDNGLDIVEMGMAQDARNVVPVGHAQE